MFRLDGTMTSQNDCFGVVTLSMRVKTNFPLGEFNLTSHQKQERRPDRTPRPKIEAQTVTTVTHRCTVLSSSKAVLKSQNVPLTHGIPKLRCRRCVFF